MVQNMKGLFPELIIHPGETIKEILNDRNMSQEELATRTGFSPKHISEVISGKKDVSSRFANKLEYALGIATSFWINLQGIYDREIIELENVNNIETNELEALKELKDITNYCENNNITSTETAKSKQVLNMRMFLNVNDLTVIPNLPIKQVAFRTSSKHKINIYVLYSWQKICHHYTNKISVESEFNKELLKSKLEDIKKTMFLEVSDMTKELEKIFKECGIAFAVVPHFKGAPVQGFIQKTNSKVILCMTIRQSFSDIFWFTLFHEIGHLINDDISNNFIDFTFENDEELEADKFASNILIPDKDYNKFITKGELDEASINNFSIKHNVKPGILVGRIQRDIDDYTFLTHLRDRYTWAE